MHYSYFDKSGSNSYSHKVLHRQVKYLPQDILTSAIEVVCNGVQEGVLWSEEALHHRHLVLDEQKAADSQAAVYRGSSTSPKEGLEGKPWCLSLGLLLTPGQCGDSVWCFYSALSRWNYWFLRKRSLDLSWFSKARLSLSESGAFGFQSCFLPQQPQLLFSQCNAHHGSCLLPAYLSLPPPRPLSLSLIQNPEPSPFTMNLLVLSFADSLLFLQNLCTPTCT